MRFLFATGMASSPWGGSEELWSQTALRLKILGHEVMALAPDWQPRPPKIRELSAAGIPVAHYPLAPGLVRRTMDAVHRRVLKRHVRSGKQTVLHRFLRCFRPDLVCISHGAIACGIEFMEICQEHGLPYVSIAQANAESLWPDDSLAERLGAAFLGAAQNFFVSETNLRLLECQVGCKLPNSELVRNPCNVPQDCVLDWPSEPNMTRLACVGRLDPSAKGQDLVLRLLSSPPWNETPLHVSFYGAGPMETALKRLARTLGVDHRVEFCGHVSDVTGIWKNHHALILPSRYEGLPLATVEAMLCGRPVITTDVAGNAEFISDGETGFVAAAPTLALLSDAMARAWRRRKDWPAIGAAAAVLIREKIPADPALVFAQRLLDVAKKNGAGKSTPR